MNRQRENREKPERERAVLAVGLLASFSDLSARQCIPD